jgi:hypothetical protein
VFPSDISRVPVSQCRAGWFDRVGSSRVPVGAGDQLLLHRVEVAHGRLEQGPLQGNLLVGARPGGSQAAR